MNHAALCCRTMTRVTPFPAFRVGAAHRLSVGKGLMTGPSLHRFKAPQKGAFLERYQFVQLDTQAL
jgi:hypothetical protein